MGLQQGANGVALVVSCVRLALTSLCNANVSRPLGASARRVLPPLDNLRGRKNAASQKALLCLFSGDYRFGARAYVWLEPERLWHHRRNGYGYKWSCRCQRDSHIDESGYRSKAQHRNRLVRQLHVREYLARPLQVGGRKDRLQEVCARANPGADRKRVESGYLSASWSANRDCRGDRRGAVAPAGNELAGASGGTANRDGAAAQRAQPAGTRRPGAGRCATGHPVGWQFFGGQSRWR